MDHSFEDPMMSMQLTPVRSDTLILDLELMIPTETTGPGFYWVRMKWRSPMGMMLRSSTNSPEYFARQIAVEPDYTLSVNPSSVREDAGATDITVSVTAKDEDDR